MEPTSAVAAAVLQVLVFAVIPFVTYLATRRRWRGFLRYVGLRACSQPALLYAVGVFLVTAAMLVVVYAVPSLRSVHLAGTSTAGQIAQLAITPASIFVIVVVSFIQTGLSEELLFRGFVAKRLIARLGFEWQRPAVRRVRRAAPVAVSSSTGSRGDVVGGRCRGRLGCCIRVAVRMAE